MATTEALNSPEVLVIRTCLISALKNEGPFLLEFVSHNIVVGFQNVILVTNPSDDWTNELAGALAEAGVIQHLCVKTPIGMKPQEHAYSEAREKFEMDSVDWLAVLDCDEFLNVHIGAGKIDDLIAELDGTVDIVSINMACFGNFPNVHWTLDDTTQKFLHRLGSAHGRNSPSKSLIHCPRNFGSLRPHGPSSFQLDRPVRVAFHGGLKVSDVESAEPHFYSLLRRTASFKDVHSIAQVNHYLIRTSDSFRIRAARGRGNSINQEINRRHTDEYFLAYSKARFFDDTILKYRTEMISVRDRLLRVPRVLYFHSKAVQEYCNKISKLCTH